MRKYGRAYSLLLVTEKGVDITIKLPFTLQFDIQRSDYASANFADIRVYNLSKIHRDQIQHDQYDNNSGANFLSVTLQAGYGDGPQWPVVFSGVATRAYSYRQGVDFITVIQAFDGGNSINNAFSTIQVPAGTPQTDIFNALLNDLIPYGVNPGAVSDFEGLVSRGQSFSGNTAQILDALSNGNFFIDNSVANVLKPGDVIARPTLLLNAESGLLGTPIKEQQFILLELLFEPRVAVGTLVQVQSTTAAAYNGPHEVSSVHHKGIISAAVAGEATTSLGLRAGVFSQVLSRAGL